MALGLSNVFDSSVHDEEFEHLGVNQVVNFEVVCYSCVNLREHCDALNTV